MRVAQAFAQGRPAFTPPFLPLRVRAKAPRLCARHRTRDARMAAPERRAATTASHPGPSYLSAAAAARLDELLMSDRFGYSLPQLMELAGQAVAHAVVRAASARGVADDATVAVAVGPGNNGGDGLVAARHILCLRPTWRVCVAAPRTRFRSLLASASAYGAHVASSLPMLFERGDEHHPAPAIVVDAVFGFSFDGRAGVRAPFDAMLADIDAVARDALLVAVDVPSGWHVEHGRVYDAATRAPDVLVSLSAPKLCARGLHKDGVLVPHYVGGRFVPPALASELGIVLPRYEGLDLVTRIA